MEEYKLENIHKERDLVYLGFGEWGTVISKDDKYTEKFNEYLFGKLQAGDLLSIEGFRGDKPEDLCIYPRGISRIYSKVDGNATLSLLLYSARDGKREADYLSTP